jgi:predicted nucleotidyltransferase
MSSDEAFVEEVLGALRDCGIEAIVIGSVAAALQGAPITTEDMDVLVRDTPRNREKLRELERRLGRKAILISPLTSTLRIPTPRAHLDILFDEIAGKLRFESLRSRSTRVRMKNVEAVVAALEDVIASKEAAGRPKDVAQLPILRDTLRVRGALEGRPPVPPR